jgi:HEAT repeat protein
MGLLSWFKRAADPAPQSAAVEPPEEPIDELAESLGAQDGAARVDAARALLDRWRAGDVRAAAPLAERLADLLEDREPQVRLAALTAVRMLRSAADVEQHASAVLARLADAAAQVRTAAVWTAARLSGPAARAQVRAVLESAEEPMRFAAACALSDQHDSAALPELTAALREGVRRQEALSAIMSLGDAAALPAVLQLFEEESLGEFDRILAAAALARLGERRGAEYLVDRIVSGGDDRPIAAEWAGRLGVQDAVPALEELADARGDPARGAALRALGRLGALDAEERLVAIASSTDEAEDVRMDAAEGLAEVGSPRALETLRALAHEPGELGPLCKELLAEVAALQRAAVPSPPPTSPPPSNPT